VRLPGGLHLGERSARDGDRVPPSGRQDDQLRAAVARVGLASHVAEALEVGDELTHPLSGDLGRRRHLGHARALRVDGLERRAMGAAQIAESGLVQASVDLALHREPHLAEHLAGGRERTAGEYEELLHHAHSDDELVRSAP
jgi:hypothetical protein